MAVTRGVIVGLGVMGRYHQRALSSLPDVEVITVDPDPDRQATCRTLTAALAAGSYDFACIATPPDTLADLAHEAIGAGLAVLVEKPLSDHLLFAEGIVHDAANRGVLLSVGYVERFNPAVRALYERLPQIGRIYQIHTRRLSTLPHGHRGVGVTLDLATHDLDIMRWLLGADPEKIAAESIDGLICATLRFPSGTIGLLEANWLTPTKIRELTIIGEYGMFTLDYAAQELCFYEQPRSSVRWDALAGTRGPGEGDMIRYAFERREPLVAQWEAFLSRLRYGGPPPVSGDDALATLSLAHRIEEATR